MYLGPLARSRDCSDCFVVICSVFYFLNALQSDDNNNTFYFLKHEICFGPLLESF